MKIATVTYQRHDNYGAMLQCYALQKKLEEIGADTQVIDYICEVSEHPFSLRALKAKGVKRYITGAIGALTRLPRVKKFREFRRLLKMTAPVNEKEISRYAYSFDGYIAGSDNIWNADITGLDENYFLTFVADKRRRASYAASFGSSKIKDSLTEKYKAMLNDIAVINCREKSGADLVESLTEKQAGVVCDPSILLKKEDWEAIAVEPKEKYPYVLAYQMVPSGEFVRFVEKFAKEKGLPVIYIPFPYGKTRCKSKLSIGPLEWLGYFKNAEFILTDSFHGCAFSVLFGRNFAVKISQLGERIENLLAVLDIKDRVVSSADEALALKGIDYNTVNVRLSSFRELSEKSLKETLDYFESLDTVGIRRPDNCTGCMLCKAVCTSDAIVECRDSLGFVYPEIIADKCVKCNRCERVCSALGPVSRDNSQRYYSAVNRDRDIVNNSGSGGVFYELASAVINMGGKVYGAAYNTGFKIVHEKAENPEEISRLMGTKYPQSDISDVYDSIKTDLLSGSAVLFVGTPCQCSAVRNYLKAASCNAEKLFVCDLFCHGVFSPKIWQEYIELLQSRFKENITYISFRDKKKGWRNKQFKIVTPSQDISKYCNNNASVLRLYEQNISFRDACYHCKYMNLNRVGDISIGDFWGIERINSKLDDNTGVSAVIISTEKGAMLLSEISANVTLNEFSASEISQQVLREYTPLNSRRKSFVEDYENGGTEKILSKYGRVKGKLYLKRNILVPLLYRFGLAGVASKFLHRKD